LCDSNEVSRELPRPSTGTKVALSAKIEEPSFGASTSRNALCRRNVPGWSTDSNETRPSLALARAGDQAEAGEVQLR